jgi:hypothetical protein
MNATEITMNRLIAFAIIAAVIVLLTGCAISPTPDYDLKFGNAVREARARMTLNPNAGANPDLAVGMDGKAAQGAITLYERSFKSPPPVVNVINIGGSAGASQ